MSFLLRNFLFYIFPKKRMINVRVCVRIQMMNVFFLTCNTGNCQDYGRFLHEKILTDLF